MSFLKPCHVPFRKLIPPFTLTAKVNTDRTSVSRVIPKTIHCLIFALRATNAVLVLLDPDRAQPSKRP